jgi:hypothetical protein
MPPPSRGPGPHVRLEDNLHLTVLVLGGGLLGGRFLRGSLLPREIGQIRKLLILKQNFTHKESRLTTYLISPVGLTPLVYLRRDVDRVEL